MRLVVYTAVFGATDRLHDPSIRGRGWGYVCFTEFPSIVRRMCIWDVRVQTYEHSLDPRLEARWYKMHPHLLFPDADASLWIDASFQLLTDPWQVFSHLGDHDLVAFRHPHRDIIRDELEAIIRCHGVPRHKLERQALAYECDGFAQSAITSTGFCLRRHNARTEQFNELWWSELLRWDHPRDQMSVDYCAFRSGLDIAHFSVGHYRENPWSRFHKAAAALGEGP